MGSYTWGPGSAPPTFPGLKTGVCSLREHRKGVHLESRQSGPVPSKPAKADLQGLAGPSVRMAHQGRSALTATTLMYKGWGHRYRRAVGTPLNSTEEEFHSSYYSVSRRGKNKVHTEQTTLWVGKSVKLSFKDNHTYCSGENPQLILALGFYVFPPHTCCPTGLLQVPRSST